MHFRRAWLLICLFAAPLAACQQNLEVPTDATLLYYGPVSTTTQVSRMLPMDSQDTDRQVYIYDEAVKKVVAVRTVDGQHKDLNFVWIQGHQYRIYFY